MKTLIFSFILIFAFAATAEQKPVVKKKASASKRKVAQSENPLIEKFQLFISCRDQIAAAKGNEWMSCFNGLTVDSQSRRMAFSQFLLGPSEIQNVSDCTQQELQMAQGFPGMTKDAVCFQFTEVPGGATRRGAAFFAKIAGTDLLYSLHQFP